MGSGLRGSGWMVARTRPRRAPASWIVPVVLALPNVAFTAPLTFELDWRAPAGCPDRGVIRRYVEEMLGSTEPATSPLNARGGVARAATDRWVADVTLRGASGAETTRSFEGPTCESVSRAAALVMALTLDSNEVPPAPPPPPAKDSTTNERPIAGRFVRPEAAPSLGIDWGSTPGLAYGPTMAVGWSPFGGARWEAFGSFFFNRPGTVAGDAALGADFALAAFGVRECYPVLDAAFSLAPCVGAGIDWLRASGFGARQPGSGSAWTLTGQASGIFLWNFHQFASIRLEVGAVIPFARPEFVIDGAGTVHRRALASIRGAAGLELHF